MGLFTRFAKDTRPLANNPVRLDVYGLKGLACATASIYLATDGTVTATEAGGWTAGAPDLAAAVRRAITAIRAGAGFQLPNLAPGTGWDVYATAWTPDPARRGQEWGPLPRR